MDRYRLNWLANLEQFSLASGKRKTGIICTLGPATSSPQVLTELREAGMNIARLNFSHGSHEYHASLVEALRASLREHPRREVAIALDTKGPEIRLGDLASPSGYHIKAERAFHLSTNPQLQAQGSLDKGIFIDYATLGTTVKKGQIVYIDDGNLTVIVDNIETGICSKLILR